MDEAAILSKLHMVYVSHQQDHEKNTEHNDQTSNISWVSRSQRTI
jgi:hypothetical protein